MNEIIIFVLFTLLSIKQINCVAFCDTKEFDRVFNIGHLVYFIRCGEVWTYDERIDGGVGDFLRDWSTFTFARKYFAKNAAEGKPTSIDSQYQNFSNKDLFFSGFSFQELSCFTHEEDLQKTCFKSIKVWNSLTVLFDKKSVISLYYDKMHRIISDKEKNPLYLPSELKYKSIAHNFFPDIREYLTNAIQANVEYMAALFDPSEDVLYMGLKYENYYCITHLNMKQMIHNMSEWPKVYIKKDSNWRAKWSHTKNCFTGNLVGMFRLRKFNYAVGQIIYTSRVYSDQVYKMSTSGDNTEVTFDEMMLKDTTEEVMVHNLRTFFGCKHTFDDKPNTRRKRSVREELFSTIEQMGRISNKWKILCLFSILSIFVLWYCLQFTYQKTNTD